EFSEALADSLAQVEGAQVPTRAPVTTLIKCPSCGAMNAANQKFCGECGASVVAVPARNSNPDPIPAPTAPAPPTASVPPRAPTAPAPARLSSEFPSEEASSGSRLVLDGDRIRFPLPL